MYICKKTIIFTILSGLLVAGCKGDKSGQAGDQASDKDQAGDQADPTAGRVEAMAAKKSQQPDVPGAPAIPDPPKGLEEATLTAHEHNPTTAEKVALGELLFFDTRLSDSGEFACVTCHVPEKGWTDGKELSPKPNGQLNKRHSPTMYNVGYALDWYWDGRMKTLEDQILAAWKGQVGGTPDKVAAALAEVPEYKVRFQRAFGEAPSGDNIPKALGSFLRIKLRSGDSPWDRYQAGDKDAVSEDVIQGEAVFNKARCSVCHAPPLYTDMKYHNIGVGYEGVDEPDVGRFKVSQNEAETGAFKTPGLRGVALTAPYFHDGSAATLEDAVDFMLAGGYRDGNEHIDPLLKPVKLSDEERAQLLAFIKALTPDPSYTPPKLP